ncbi:hypothetical protein F4780DRAFT_668211 [Xylariomycetidae sp. FL0641]|nr:hypothetical protein F4780DRAFT_668211 [Xylariomycetidae sp. FL0641]
MRAERRTTSKLLLRGESLMPRVGRNVTCNHRRPRNLERKESSKSRKANPDGRDSDKSNNVDQNSITVASESPDIEMRDAPVAVMSTEVDAQAERERQDAKTRQAEADATAAAEEEARKEAVRARQEEERRKREAEARIKEREAEAEARRLEQEERQRLAREELKRKEDEENARLEAEQKKREEEDQKRREEEERREKEEQDRKQREEEERIRREREAAEARRRQEEEDRLEEERKRAELAAREAELQRAREEEEERARVAKLPPLFRWLDACPDPKRKEIAELFAKPRGIRYDTIVPSATGQPGGRDQWLLNTQVALLLGEKDLTLSRYPHWERIPAGHFAKLVIWRIEQEAYSLTQQKVYHLGRQLPGYYDGDPYNFGTQMLLDLKAAAWPLWTEMDMFFVKESDFLQLVPTVPHLRDVKISIWYCELPEDEEMLRKLLTPKKWKRDPDAVSRGFAHFAPRAKHYVNAQLVGEDKPQKYTPSKTPFPENRVPRRRGYVAVEPHESDYVQLCLEQNLTHLLTEQQKQSALNGAHLTPRSMASNELADYTVGTPSSSTNSRVGQVNGVPDTQATPEELANGTDDDESDSGH